MCFNHPCKISADMPGGRDHHGNAAIRYDGPSLAWSYRQRAKLVRKSQQPGAVLVPLPRLGHCVIAYAPAVLWKAY